MLSLALAPHRLTLALAAVGLLGSWLLVSAWADEPDTDQSAEIVRWIAELDSDLYVVRERAVERLAAAGPEAMDPLSVAADGNNLEVASQAVRLLLEMSNAEQLDVSIAALKRIAALKNRPAESRAATAVLSGMREREALAAIKRFGGVDKGQVYADGEPVLGYLHLGESWTGGDEGLVHIKHLSQLQRLSIHGAPITDAGLAHLHGVTQLGRLELFGTKVTQAGVDALAKTLPHTEVDFRSGAMLGVGGVDHPQGAQVTFIQPESAAWQAGIRPGDVITRFNDQGFVGFQGLTRLIAKCQPGEKAQLDLLRDNATISKEIEFGKWR